ncbi:MAG: heat-inducible transcriptional repressor HrcA [Acidimicrobiales bacterium]
MLDDRKAAILRAVVEEYIQTAQPVGSAHVARNRDLLVSSATVRNDMGVLEREGYLVQPHTSAGRIPTDKGYRFFVDSLDSPGPLDPSQTQQVRSFFAKAHGELERMLADTSRLLSGLTDYAAVVVKPSADVARIRSAQLVGLGSHTALMVVVLSNGSVEKRTLEITEQTGAAHMAAASAHLGAHLDGRAWEPAPAASSTGEHKVDDLVRRAVALVGTGSGVEAEQVFVGGAARMVSAFDAVDTIRQVLGILEQQYVLVSLLRDVIDRGLSVAIGTEHGVLPLADCSIIVAPYEVEGEQVGTVGILGPTRMHYEQALAAVAVVSKRLSRALSEGT